MAEREIHHEVDASIAETLVDKPVADMSLPEWKAWYLEYMKTVPEENVMMLSGMPIETTDDPQAFEAFVETKLEEMRGQSREV